MRLKRFLSGPIFFFIALTTLFLTSETAYPQEQLTSGDCFIEGIRYYNIEDFSTAEELFLKAIAKEPDNDAAYYYLGLSYYGLHDTDRAEEYLKKAQETDPSNFWYRIKLAQFYSQTGRIEVALPLYENLVEDYPSKSSIYYEIIDLYTDNGQIDKALETLDKIESLKGENEATGNARYELLNMQGKYEEAAVFLEKYFQKYPSPRAAFILGDIYKAKFADSTAINYYTKSLAMDPTYAPAHYGLAETYRMKRDLPNFFKNIYQFLSSSDMNLGLKTNYIKEVALNPQFIRAFKSQTDTMITCVVNAHPKDSTALFFAGAYYIQTGMTEEGKAMYYENLQNYPDDLHSNVEYISLLYYLKDWKSLIDQLHKTIPIFPSDKSFEEILAIAYWQDKQIDEAIAVYRQMLKMVPKNSPEAASYYSALGDLYHEKKLPKKSYSYYDKVLKITPDYNPVLNNYAYYLSLEGKNMKKAAQMSKKTILSEPDNPTYLDTYAWILHLLGEDVEAKGYFKHAMLYGGKDSAVIIDHYADVLFALKEYDLAFIYWDQANKMDSSLGIAEKIILKKAELKK